MPFPHKSTAYKEEPHPNPFLEGQDKAYGDLLLNEQKRSKFNLFVTGIGSLVLFAAAILVLLYAISLQKTIPVIIYQAPSGEATYLGEAKQTGSGIQVTEASIFFQIRKYISNIRSIYTDPYVIRNNIVDCYAMVTSSYHPIMNRWLQANSPFDLVGKTRRSVEIESILRTTGNSYQVDWVETSIESGGAPINKKMRGIITIKLIPPDPSFIKTNPLGIFIDAFEWTEL